MLRKLVIAAALVALVLPAAASAQLERVLLMPGVTYERQVQFTSHGPVAIHVVHAPKPGGLYSLTPVLSNGAIVGREKVSSMQQSIRDATAVGVNGDLFAWADARPSGILMRSGVLDHPPLAERSSIGITADGALRVDRIRFFGTWRGAGQRRPLDLNQSPTPNGVSLFTPSWGPVTPALEGTTEAVIQPFPTAIPNADISGPVVQYTENGNTPIPPDGAVVVARGTAAQRLLEEAPMGTTLTVRLLLSPDWVSEGVVHAIGGGPVLVRNAKPVFRHFELFTTAQLARSPRTAVGQLADGRIVLVVVDGRRPGYSVGMTNFELAQTLVRLGAVTGSGLDGGGSSTVAFDGKVLNKPADRGGERSVSEGLFVLYEGVFAPPPAESVVSPNGDGVAEAQGFSYKLARPSSVTVSLVGPDGEARALDAGEKAAGWQRFVWNPVTAEGQAEPEGRWRLTVTATDDRGRISATDRLFVVNNTLAGLRLSPSLVRVRKNGGRLAASFSLTRPARVTVTVRTRFGAILATLGSRSLPAGEHTIEWNGRIGRKVAHSGRFVLRVRAANEVGHMELAQEFAVRRVAERSEAGG